MRYRSFGRSGKSISDLTLNLSERTLARGKTAGPALVTEAMENGINSFLLETPDTILAELVGRAVAGVDRHLIFVAVRVGNISQRGQLTRDFSPAGVTAAIDAVLLASGIEYLDMVLLDDPHEDELSHATLSALKALRASGRIQMLGIAGGDKVMDAYVSTSAFDVLTTPFNVDASWTTRNRISAATSHDMAVVGYDFFPDYLSSLKKIESGNRPKWGLFDWGRSKHQDSDLRNQGLEGFAFLHQTPGWTAEEICLSYALSEPMLASVVIDTSDSEHLARLAELPERTLPPGMVAQIEMARVKMASARTA